MGKFVRIVNSRMYVAVYTRNTPLSADGMNLKNLRKTWESENMRLLDRENDIVAMALFPI